MRGFVSGLGVTAILLVSWNLAPVGAQEDASRPEYYTTKVKPIFDANCMRCHSAEKHKGGLNMESTASMVKGGRDGSVLTPGDPDKSLLVRLMRHEGPANDPMPMPPNKPKVSDADIAVVTAWVKAGAIMPGIDAKP